jgi:hypothetical protein
MSTAESLISPLSAARAPVTQLPSLPPPATFPSTSPTPTSNPPPPPPSSPTPPLPQRPTSLIRKSEEILSCQRSIHQPSYTTSHSSTSTNELAQVRKPAEEYGGGATCHALSEEEQALFSRGLCKFSAADYAAEIEWLYCEMIGKPTPVLQ